MITRLSALLWLAAPGPGQAATPLSPPLRHTRPLVILASFPDGPPEGVPSHSTTPEQWAALLFGDHVDPVAHGLPATYATSLRDYLDEASGGAHLLDGGEADVVGWIEAPHPYAWYADGQRGRGEPPRNSAGLVTDLVAALDPALDLDLYDRDGDGDLDSVIVVTEGWGSRTGELFWPHVDTVDDPPVHDGVRITRYLVVNEVEEQTVGDVVQGDIQALSVLAHEFGHILGIPDLYDRDGSSWGIGRWGLMGTGFVASQTRPVAPCAWTRVRLGWDDPITAPPGLSQVSLDAVADGGGVVRIWTDPWQHDRAILVENRQPWGIDAAMDPAAGLLVWAVDEGRARRFPVQNDTNDDEGAYGVKLIEADGRGDLESGASRGDAGDPFPGLTDNRAAVLGEAVIRTISDSGPTMTAFVQAATPRGYTLAHDEHTALDPLPDARAVRARFPVTAAGSLHAVRLWHPVEADAVVHIGETTVTATLAPEAWTDVEVEASLVYPGDLVEVTVEVPGGEVWFDSSGPVSGHSWWSVDGEAWEALDGDFNLRVLVDVAVDLDGDGVTIGDGDCNDLDATVHPGAVELCDEVDRDCDGIGDDADVDCDVQPGPRPNTAEGCGCRSAAMPLGIIWLLAAVVVARRTSR